MTGEKWTEYLIKTFGTMRHVPIAFLTSQEGRNVKPLVNLAQTIYKQSRIRVPTAEINKVVRAALQSNAPHYRRNKRPKIFFATQVSIEPPTIVLKCNNPILFDETWKRYLLGVMREELPFHEVPIRLYYRTRSRGDEMAKSLDE